MKTFKTIIIITIMLSFITLFGSAIGLIWCDESYELFMSKIVATAITFLFASSLCTYVINIIEAEN